MIGLQILAVLTLIQGAINLILGRRAAGYMRDFPAPPADDGGSAVAVFCPCRGVDAGFETNIRSILEQDFLRFSVYFIVDSERDPACAALRRMGAANILVAGPATDCGQKVHNLVHGVKQAGAGADVYVFCDSDARFPRTWLRSLTSVLGDHNVATGYRWYVADRFHIPTLLRSAWNASAVSLLGAHGRNFVWGGSTAIRRQTFERLEILEEWQGAVSDDYAITRAAQRTGTTITFVPTCLIPSHGECTFRELLEFTTRQIIITRVYQPRLWRVGLAAQTMFNVTFWALLAFAGRRPELLLLWLAIYALSGARARVRFFAVRGLLRDPSLSRFAWFYILSSPAVALLYQYNMFVSALTSDIEWRQIHYSLISPNRTRVRRSSASAS